MQQPMGELTVDDGIMILDDASVVLIEEPSEVATPWDLDDADTRVWIRPYAARFHASRPSAEAGAGAWSQSRSLRRALPRPHGGLHRGYSTSRSM